MFRVKRNKIGAVTYATGVSPDGQITGLDKNPGKAAKVSPILKDRVVEAYEKRKQFGTLTFEPVDATASELASMEADASLATEQAFKSLQAEVISLRRDNGDLTSTGIQARADLKDKDQQIANLNGQIIAMKGAADDSSAKIIKLTQQLAESNGQLGTLAESAGRTATLEASNAELQKTANEAVEQAKTLTQQLAERDEQIATLTKPSGKGHK